MRQLPDSSSGVSKTERSASSTERSKDLEKKEANLRAIFRGMGRVIVAFSGGVDSATLLRFAVDELGADAVRALLAVGPSLPERDLVDARALAARIGVELETIETKEYDDERYLANGPDRCYWCRQALVDALAPIAEQGGAAVVYGALVDDLGDDRPGMKAAERGGIKAPFIDAGMTKSEVRELARRSDLPVWNKPASACLSSRIPTGTRISVDKLQRVDRAERALHELGFEMVRVRDHGDVARVELAPDDIEKAVGGEVRVRVVAAVREAGFHRVTVDLEGYRPAGLSAARLPSADRS